MSVSAAATRRKQREQPTNCRQGVMPGKMSAWVRCGQAGLNNTKVSTFEELIDVIKSRSIPVKQVITSLHMHRRAAEVSAFYRKQILGQATMLTCNRNRKYSASGTSASAGLESLHAYAFPMQKALGNSSSCSGTLRSCTQDAGSTDQPETRRAYHIGSHFSSRFALRSAQLSERVLFRLRHVSNLRLTHCSSCCTPPFSLMFEDSAPPPPCCHCRWCVVSTFDLTHAHAQRGKAKVKRTCICLTDFVRQKTLLKLVLTNQ